MRDWKFCILAEEANLLGAIVAIVDNLASFGNNLKKCEEWGNGT